MTTCSTCRYWETFNHNWPDIGRCVRKAPTPADEFQTGVWPTTHESNWCGEWEARP